MRETTEDELKSTVMNLLFQLPEKDREEILAPYFPKRVAELSQRLLRPTKRR